MIDPPREGVKEAVNTCKRAGIKTVMITGDHIATAKAIAKELNILEPQDKAITGKELDQIPQEKLVKEIKNYSVFARVTPEHKVRIVKAWQKAGSVVAMTGDGVNDSPALKNADIGIAMGKNGTDVAKNAADMILTDDNFVTIVKAVKQGRNIYDNIKKAIHFLISTNIGENEKELSKIASGGEMSRTMLAIKKVLADSDKTEVLVFDEIDTGISGKAANAVANKLKAISEKHQVMCISHLPNIAAKADYNYFISKDVNDERTKTKIKLLQEDEVIKEIARISSGEINEISLKYATELRNKKVS